MAINTLVLDTLWPQIAAGDKAAFMLMYDKYYQQLYAFGASVYPDGDVIKDGIHDMFCELWETRSQERQIVNTKAYLFTYLKRKLLRQIHQLESLSETDGADGRLGITLSYEEILIRMQKSDEQLQRLSDYLNKLTATQREVIRLRFYENLSYNEIAGQLGIETRTAYNHAHEALKALKGHFKPAFFIALSVLLGAN